MPRASKSPPDATATEQHHWLMKSEPDDASVDHVLSLPGHKIPWFGVRNYQARNFMRDQMQVGDPVFFYHSSCAEPGIVGLAEVASKPYPDASQFEARGKYFDPKSSRDNPRWIHVDVKVLRKTRTIGLAELRQHPELADMVVLRKGNRLSITPVTSAEWAFITGKLLRASSGR